MRSLYVLTHCAECYLQAYNETELRELRSAVQNAKYVMEHVTIPTAEVDNSGNRQLHNHEAKQRNQVGPSDILADSASIDSRP